MKKLSVFLCHATTDKPIVRELYQSLNATGWIDPWLDEEKLLPGMEWDMEIEKAVEDADVVLVCLSNYSVNKEGYIQRELKYVVDIALEKPDGTIFIVPVRLDDVQPPRRLRSWQYVDYFPTSRRNWANGRILASLQIRAQALGIETLKRVSHGSLDEISIKLEENSTTNQIQKRLLESLSGKKLDTVPLKESLTGINLNTPANLMYTKSDEWFDPVSGSMGLTDYAQCQLSDIVFVEPLVNVGDVIDMGAPICSIESVKASAEVYAAAGGIVTAVNNDLSDVPETLNTDPYGEGWMIKVKHGKPISLMKSAEYRVYCDTRSH